jgi:hypothetical protein
MLTGLFSGLTAYRLSIPGLRVRTFTLLSILSGLGVLLTIPWGSTYVSTIADDINIRRGMCGVFITIMSSIAATFFFMWSRKNAPTNYVKTGFWIVLSTSCFGSAAVQLICSHDSVLHLYLWHILPTVTLAWVGTLIGKKILKW